MNEDFRDFASDVSRVSDWIAIIGLIWLVGLGLFVAAVMFRWF